MLVNSVLLEINVVKVFIISWLEQHLCSEVQLMWLEAFASLASTTAIFLSMHPSVGQDTLKKMGLKLCVMTTSQFPAFSLPPFSCLVTPAVWVSGPPWLSSRDAGPRRLSFLIRLLALRRAWGQSNCVYACVCVCVFFGWRVCQSAYVCYFAVHALRWWESVSGSMDVHVLLHYAIMWEFGQFGSVCFR